jgi:hypothetical protein
VSIHADDEYSLKFAVESELDDVMPSDGLAGLVIARYHKTRRRRIAGAVGLFVIFAGLGVPIGLTASGGSSGSAVLRIATFTLKLPQQYHAAPATACTAATAVPRPRVPADDPVAATAPAGCVLMLLAPAGTEPPSARPVAVGSYHGWLVPAGTLIITGAAPGEDLIITESHLSEPQFLRLVASGLS